MTAPIADGVLQGLKDFQRATVEYVFDRLYAAGSSGRFLVADEVGLGKTMVARGIIAKTIDRLRPQGIRVDVVYICSNAEIARQNINRLKVGDEEQVSLASRLTLLPQELHQLTHTKSGVNLSSFTPATSFDVHRGLGRADERVLLYWMLRRAWDFGGGKAAMNVFQGTSAPESFRGQLERFDASCIQDRSHTDFARALDGHLNETRVAGTPSLRDRFEALCAAYSRADRTISRDISSERYRFVGELRAILAASCVHALEPDLIILDEFQRFAHLLDGDDDASRLARALFTYPDVRVLLLSATPYKMYTTADESTGEDHYEDFRRTVRFLERSELTDKTLDDTLAGYRESLLTIGDQAGGAPTDLGLLARAREQLETRLRRVMVRTERLASTPDRSGMLVEVPPRPMRVEPIDLHGYVGAQRVAREVDADDTMELWKSAPFVLNFIDDNYKIRRKIDEALEDGEGRARLARALGASPRTTLRWEDAEAYAAIDPGNARMRALFDDTVANGAWRLLWIPPSLPYYRLGGAYGDPATGSFTKRLVFSSWRIAPRAIAALTSYEVERRMMAGDPEARNTTEARRRRRGLLRFSVSEGRLTGMPVLALLYPSHYLARACDPAALLAERAREGNTADVIASVEGIALDDVLAIARERIEVGLRRLRAVSADGPVDERWYWAAPLLLDRALDAAATRAWFEQEELAAQWAGGEEEPESADAEGDEAPASTRSRSADESDAWEKHVEQARAIALSGTGAILATTETPLGRMPDDLVEVLAELAVAGPAVAMFRALDRVVGGERALSPATRTVLRNGAGRTAWSFRAVFNRGSVTWMLRGGARGQTDVKYWRQVLRYCAEGCLPSVLDEYVHVLRDHLGLVTGNLEHRVHEIAEEMREALELRPAQVRLVDYTLSDSGRTVRAQPRNLLTQFAARLADETNDDGTKTRADSVRKAFNSPFWPFVLATTSVGQEGLDFHPYCHAVVHWNLPSNPVDLEQREGRVHRYKGHAVRRNVARMHGWSALASDERDVWQSMFDQACEASRDAGTTEIVPFWVYPVDGGARIERHVLALPLSREHGQLARLRSSLAIYRMVFGQPRQEDLVQYLLGRVPAAELDRIMGGARIDLSPLRP